MTPSATNLLALALATTGPLSAVGFRLPNQDPEAIARGNAFTATADNPSALYYNPAGITQLEGQHLSIGVYAISAGAEFTSPLGTAATDTSFQFAPQIYYVNSPEDSPFSYGVGVFAPYGLGLDYGRATPFPTAAIEGELLFATVNPTVAYQINPDLSLGFGLALNYSEISFTRSLGIAPGDFTFAGDDMSVGFNAGALWQPVDQWSFGLNFRSSSEMTYRGTSTALGGVNPTQARIHFPMNLAAGVSYRPTDKWNIEVGVDWTDWDSVDLAVLQGTAFGDVPFPFNYESGFMYQLGVTRQLENGYFASAGYIYSDNSAPDLTFTPLNPDSNLHLWSLGFGRKLEQTGWAFSYTLAYNGGHDVIANLNPTVNGTYDTINHALNFSYQFSF
ncbi:MAG: OmpP1/FadL family transporter [Verrucomicrobiaceae bacterium]